MGGIASVSDLHQAEIAANLHEGDGDESSGRAGGGGGRSGDGSGE